MRDEQPRNDVSNIFFETPDFHIETSINYFNFIQVPSLITHLLFRYNLKNIPNKRLKMSRAAIFSECLHFPHVQNRVTQY